MTPTAQTTTPPSCNGGDKLDRQTLEDLVRRYHEFKPSLGDPNRQTLESCGHYFGPPHDWNYRMEDIIAKIVSLGDPGNDQATSEKLDSLYAELAEKLAIGAALKKKQAGAFEKLRQLRGKNSRDESSIPEYLRDRNMWYDSTLSEEALAVEIEADRIAWEQEKRECEQSAPPSTEAGCEFNLTGSWYDKQKEDEELVVSTGTMP